MPRWPKLDTHPPKRKRTFFSSAKLPALQVVRPSTPPRPVASERILAALEPDTKVVTAAKTFVKENMRDEKFNVPEPAVRVTQQNVAPPPQSTTTDEPLPKRRGRPPVEKTIVPNRVDKAVDKRFSKAIHRPSAKRPVVGSGSITQRIKIKASAAVTRKITLRTSFPSDTQVLPQAESEAPPVRRKEPEDVNPVKKKDYMSAGLYCQDAEPPTERVLVNAILAKRGHPLKRGPGRPRKSNPLPLDEDASFPPLPLDHGFLHFFEQEHDFALPYNIMWESESGALDGKKRPPFYGKLRTNQFIERPRCPSDGPGICKCDPESGCGDNCINRIMSYLCGKDCPCGDNCTNKSLTRRKGKANRVQWTGSRGFGLFATEDIAQGDFVIDYRGEVVHVNTFMERIGSEYKGQRNFYALAYDGNEVIDAGLRGNDARFINHGCMPNLEVRKYQILGDGYEEFEIGMFAKRAIKAGEELFYDYNFEAFSVTSLSSGGGEMRTRCECGAPNCSGFLGRKAGEKSAKERAVELDAKAAEEVRRAEIKAGKQPATSSSAAAASNAAGQSKRPPGQSGHSKKAKALAIDPVTGEPPVKRKRGRPPKPRPLDAPPIVKRPRGRPRIHPLPDPNVPVAKRPRGRPRKHPLPDVKQPVAGPSTAVTGSVAAGNLSSEVGPKRTGRPAKGLNRAVPYPVKRSKPSKLSNLVQTVTGLFKRTTALETFPPSPLVTTTESTAAPSVVSQQIAPEPVETKPLMPLVSAPTEPIVNPLLGAIASTDAPASPVNLTPKQAAKSKRNGAPCGWAYVPVGAPVPPPEAAEAELTPSGRAVRLAARR